MNIKRSKLEKITICIATLLIAFALFTDSFINIIYRSRIIQIITITIALLFFCFIALKYFSGKINVKILFLEILWMLTLPFVLFRNADLKSGSGSSYVIYYMMAIIILIILKYKKDWIDYLAKFMIIGSNIYAFFTIFFKIFKSAYYYVIPKIYSGAILTQVIQQYEEKHMAGIASHYSTNGIYLALGIGVIIFYYIPKKSEDGRYKKIYILNLLILIIAFIFNGKRGTLIFCVAAIVVAGLSQLSIKELNKILKIILLAGTLLLITTLVIYLVPSIQESIFKFLRLDSGKDLNDISSGRVDLYRRALEDFKSSPMWGSGWGYYKHKYAYMYSYVGEGFYMDVHNIYIQLLSEVGIVGFTVFIVAMLLTLKLTVKVIKKNSFKMLGLSKNDLSILKLSVFLQSFFIFYGFTGNPLYDYWVFMIYILGISMFFTIYNLKQYQILI